jgi:hypothetical protein
MKTEEELPIFEQHLYLRQPGYGTSYVTGKYLLEQTLADWRRQRQEQVEAAGEPARLRDFFDHLHDAGNIPDLAGAVGDDRARRRRASPRMSGRRPSFGFG